MSMKIWPAPCTRNWSSAPRTPASNNTKSPTSPAPAPSTLNYQLSTSPAAACLHNVNYWRGGSFYGLGPSATTYVRGVRTKNCSNTQLYCEQLEQGRRAARIARSNWRPLARAGETAAFGLRMVAGWPFEQFRQVTGYDLRREWAEDMNQLVEQGRGRILPDRFQLTREGLRFADCRRPALPALIREGERPHEPSISCRFRKSRLARTLALPTH